ncbi:autotransporter-associated beta strand repeat-containing protein, partial [Polynucleobacter sp. UK-Kesae-W10]|uniref:beta strand repeat-containing protein n=1 Tax=Polynucleobacter sp. UK-Kesae-W10 TaxID=1819738 RepID=UPI001C0BB1A5
MTNASRNLGISFLLSKKHAHRNDGHGVGVRKTVIAGMVLSASLLAVPSAFAAPAANALPTNGQVVAGQASINQAGNVMNINQSTQRAVINWDSFNVGKNATVNFNQPNANSSTLNRVNGASKSMIDGAIRSNGQVIFVNPNGVVFGKGAEVNTGGLVATTMDIKDSDYMSGKMKFSGGESGKVINKGTITANGVNGYIALMAPEVRNQGILIANIANSNSIALVSGTKVTLSFNGSQLTDVTVDASAINSLVSNKHAIITNGGQIIIAANAASNLKASVINNTGTINSDSITTSGGKVFLTAGTVNQSGAVSANSETQNAGQVVISGNQIKLNESSKTTATGATSGGQILIGKTNANTAQSQVNADVVAVAKGAIVDASATKNGNGGSISIWSQVQTMVAGTLKAMGGAISGNGGNIDTSSAKTVTYGSSLVVDTTAPHGKTGNWTTDPLTIIIDSSNASVLSNALNTTNVTLDATAATCGIVACTQSSTPVITFLADVYSANPLTSLYLNAQGGSINVNSNVTAGTVYAVAQTININGSLNTNGGSNSSIYLAGAIINILGNINSNGNSNNNTSSSNLNSANIVTANNRRNSMNGQNGLTADNTIYTSNGGAINIIASGDINIGSNTNATSYISANGQNGGSINIVSVNGNVNNYGIVDAVGQNNLGGAITLTAQNTNTFNGALIAADGYTQGGVIQIGIANGVGSGSTLAPPSINSQVATLLAAVNFTPSSNILSSNTSLDNATVITANAASSNSSSTPQVVLNSQAGQIYVAGNNFLNTAATIQANADNGGLIILSSPAGTYQNTGYVQTNGGAGLGGTIAQSGLISTSLIGATLEANGQQGGGNIITGRDFQASPLPGSVAQDALLPSLSSVVTVPTSQLTTVDANSIISANAITSGNGGNVLVWGDNLAAYGTFNAQALGTSGNGGLIETSGNQLILNSIAISASSQNGLAGTWLLDPYDVTIAASGASGTAYSATFTAGATSTILASAINSSLTGGTSVSISTGSSSANTIFVNSAISATTGSATLTLTGGTINIAANITTAGSQTYTGAVVINNASGITLTTTNSAVSFSSTVDSYTSTNNALTISSGSGAVSFGGNVGTTTALGSLSITGVSGNATGQTTTLSGNVTTTGLQSYGGNLTLTGSAIALNTTNSAVTVTGNVVTNGSSFLLQYNLLQILDGGSYIFDGVTFTNPSASTTYTNQTLGTTSATLSYSGSTSGSYSILTYNYSFNPNGTFTNSQYLVVGGGGMGNGLLGGGGGGGGGVLSGSVNLTSIAYSITVGAGGSSARNVPTSGPVGYWDHDLGISGNPSSIGGGLSVTALGGYGGTDYIPGSNGASGSNIGGAGANWGVGILYNASNIGLGSKTCSPCNSPGLSTATTSGGGGGSGGNGSGVNGGPGVASSITGQTVYYGGGGSATGGTASGGGGTGGSSPTAGQANTGGGGGGGNGKNGAYGGSGVVMLGFGTLYPALPTSLTINSGSGQVSIGGTVTGLPNLTINSSNSANIISGVISTATNLIKTCTGTCTPVAVTATNANSVNGTLILAANNTYTGTTTITSGTIQIGNGGTTGSIGVGALSNSGNFAFGFSNNQSWTTALACASATTCSISQNGSGTETLTASNTFTGTTFITNGTLALTGTGSIATSAGVITSNGGSFDISGTTTGASIVSLAGPSTSTAVLGGKILTITNANDTFNGVISGTGGSVVLSAGTFTFAGANTYSGGTTLNGGTAFLGSGSGANTGLGSGTVNINSGSTLLTDGSSLGNALVLNGGTLQGTNIQGQTWNGNISVTSASTINANASPIYLNGVISGSSALSVSGGGSVILTGSTSNTYSGTITINSGSSVQVGNAATSGNLGSAILANNGNLIFNRNDAIIVSNNISGSGSVIQNGSGALTLSGASNFNTYSGGTVINAGTLKLGSDFTVTTSAVTSSPVGTGNVTINAGGILDLNGHNFGGNAQTSNLPTIILSGTGVGSNQALLINSSTTTSVTEYVPITLSNSFASPGTLTDVIAQKTGNQTLTIAGVVGDGAGANTVGLQVGNTGYAGTVIFTGANTYAGGTTIGSGATLKVSSGGTSGSNLSVGDVTLNSGTLIDSTTSTIGNNFILGNGTNEIGAAANQTATISGGVTANGATPLNIGDTTNTGNVIFSGLSITSLSNFPGGISNNGGTGILIALDVYTGANGGLWSTASNWSLGIAPISLILSSRAIFKVQINSLSSVNYDTAATQSISDNIVNNGSITFVNGASVILSGNISGVGTITQSGSGVVTLSGANTYNGVTTISSGTLAAKSATALGSGLVSIGANSTLDLRYPGTVTLGSLSMDPSATITNSTNNSGLTVLGASSIGNSVTTNAAQNYLGANLIVSNAVLNTTNASVSFGSTLDSSVSNYALTINPGNGAVTFGSTVGGVTPLSALTVTGATGQNTFLNADVNTTGNQSYGGNLVLNGVAINLNSTQNGSVSVAGSVTTTGTGFALSYNLLQLLGGGAYIYDGGSFTATGTPVNLGGATLSWNGTNYVFTPLTTYANASYLVVGGGGMGNGSASGGGGGGGGVLYGSTNLTSIAYSITVGAGGSVVGYWGHDNGVGGSRSSIGGGLSVTALGGYGGSDTGLLYYGFSGSNFGGVGYGVTTAYTSSNAGVGTCIPCNSSGLGTANSAGGGGGSGGNGSLTNGGPGLASDITGQTVYYGGGGSAAGGTASGGGGIGGSSPTAGQANTGGGGGGNSAGNGAFGGSGVVMLGYGVAPPSYLTTLSVNTGSGAVTIGGGVNLGSITINSSNAANSITGAVTGSTSVTKTCTGACVPVTVSSTNANSVNGTLVLAANNTYTGTTTITQGTIQFGNGGTTGSIGSGAVTNNGNLAFNLSTTQNYTIGFTGAGAITQMGSGALNLSGSSQGSLFINAGTLSPGTLNSSNAIIVNGGTLALGSVSQTSGAVYIGANGGAISGTGVLTAPSYSFANNSNVTISESLAGSGATFTQSGTGITTLSASNTFTGNMSITAGTIKMGAVGSLGGTNSTSIIVTVGSGATLDLNGQPSSQYGNSSYTSLVLNGGTLTNSNISNLATYANSINVTADSLIGGAGPIKLTGLLSALNNNLAFIGTNSIQITNGKVSNIASAAGIGAFSIANGNALTVGSMTIGGMTYSGISSTGIIYIGTAVGNLTVNNAITTTSTSATPASPAITLAAGYSDTTSIINADNLVLNSIASNFISAGSGAVIAMYSGSASYSGSLGTFAAAKSATITYSATVSTLPSSTPGYYVMYRGSSQPTLYIIFSSSSNPIYGSAPSIAYTINSLANGTGTTYTLAAISGSGAAVFQGNNITTGANNVQLNSLANAGSYNNVLYVSGLSSPNYQLTGSGTTAGTLTVTPAPLGVTVNATYQGNGSTISGASNITLYGLVGNDVGGTASSATLNAAGNATTGGSLTVSSLVTSGWSLANYALSSTATSSGSSAGTMSGSTNTNGTNTVIINKANLTATGTEVYNGTSTFSNGNLTVTGINGQTFTLSGGTISLANNGNVQSTQAPSALTSITLSGVGGSLATNYNALTTAQTTLSVTPAPLGVTVNATYQGNGSTISGASNITLYGLVGNDLGGTASNASLSATGNATIGGSLKVNSLATSGWSLSNYALSSTATSSGSSAGTMSGSTNTNGTNTVIISKANLVLSGSETYNGTKVVAGTTLTAYGVNGQTFAITGSGDATNLITANVQSNSVLNSLTGLTLGASSNGGVSANYNSLSTSGSTYTINPAPLGVTVNATYQGNGSTISGASNITVYGLVGSDVGGTASSATLSAVGNATAGGSLTVNSLTPTSGWLFGNYALSSTPTSSGSSAGTMSGSTNANGTNTVIIGKANAYVIIGSGQTSVYGATPVINYTYYSTASGAGGAAITSL